MADHPQGLEYFIVDVFTERAFEGNPLAVVMNTAQLTTEQMQAIAVEFNLSETTFVERRAPEIEAQEGVRVRIFTVGEELQFAGHPTLGTASVLKQAAPEVVRDGVVTLAENVGPIPVRFEGGTLFGEMTQPDPTFGPELDRDAVARFCGLGVEDLDAEAAPQIVSTGTPFAIVMLRSVEALGRLRVQQEESSNWLRGMGARWFYALAPMEGADGAKGFRARMQFNVGEDPATGSAAGCAVSYLVNRGLAPDGRRFPIWQGIEMGRPSTIYGTARRNESRVGDVRVAGSTVPVANGRLFLQGCTNFQQEFIDVSH